jgi:hypothetical protein
MSRQAVPADKFYYSPALFDGCLLPEVSELLEDTLGTNRAAYSIFDRGTVFFAAAK